MKPGKNWVGVAILNELHWVGLHWRVPFIEVLSETTSGLVAGSHDSEEHT